MKKLHKLLMLTTLFCLLIGNTVFASDAANWQKVKFKMNVPDGVDIPSPVYVMYTGADTDLFAELSSENSFTTEVQALPGTYTIYQIVPSFDTDLEFMGTSSFVVDADNPDISIYIKNADGIVNADDSTPSDLASYGETISAQIEAEQAKEQQALVDQQNAAANAEYKGQGTLSTQPGQQGEEALMDSGERQSKITDFTGTTDATKSLTGLVIIGAVILGVGVLVIIAVLTRKYKKISEEKSDGNKQNEQNANYIGNR